ncbi:MAG TPA: heme-binding domain-containing protein [Kofleriaceae bacterium]|jgi:mono/diheme cytochrome c family protein|nr:heme-binding domain-containing protein [Kofleriaceae bacterium]
MARAGWKKVLVLTGLVFAGLLLAVQLVPYGRSHSNPPMTAEPSWNAPGTRALAQRACFDCHSNETRWPWYSHVAPVSWLVQADVDEGRRVLNFSEWTRAYEEAPESGETVREQEMPPRSYLLLHPEARLSDAERQQLAAGLDATLGPARSSEHE